MIYVLYGKEKNINSFLVVRNSYRAFHSRQESHHLIA